MEILANYFVNDRTFDGRVVSLGQGTRSFISDDDEGMVELVRQLAQRGQITILGTEDAERAEEITRLEARLADLRARFDARRSQSEEVASTTDEKAIVEAKEEALRAAVVEPPPARRGPGRPRKDAA